MNLKILVFFFILIYAKSINASEKIYYVDIDFLINNSSAGKSINIIIDKKNKEKIEKFKKIEKDLVNDETQLISQKNILKPDEFNQKLQELKKKISDYRIMKNTEFKKLSESKIKAQSSLIESLRLLLSEYAEENSVSLILPKKNILIGRTEMDITKNILEKLDEKVKEIKIK
jgi:outer membrane protein